MKRIFLLALLLISNFAMAEKKASDKKGEVKASEPELAKIITAVQAQYNKIENFSAEFSQEFHHKVLKKKDQSLGKIKFKKPGMMRWDYEKPTEKSFIVDGKSLWIYQPKDKSVMVNKCFKEDKMTASLSFLWGQGDIANQFESKIFKGQFGNASEVHIQLTPKEKSPHYKKIILVIDPKKNMINQSVVVDLEGNINQFKFKNIIFDGNIASKDFVFITPKGFVESSIPGSEENCEIQKKAEKQPVRK